MNEDQIITSPGGLGGGMLANPEGSVAQVVQGGLGKVGSPAPQQQGYARNSSLEMFEVANAEKQKAKEMQFENEALRARGDQMKYKAENSAMKDNQINQMLKAGQLDEETALGIISDPSVSDSTKQNIANVFYPAQAAKTWYSPSDKDHSGFGLRVDDEDKQAEIYAQSRAAGTPGARIPYQSDIDARASQAESDIYNNWNASTDQQNQMLASDPDINNKQMAWR